MKKILFLLAILPMFLMGCSDDDDSDKKDKFAYDINLLYGSWDIVDGMIGMSTFEFTKDGRYSISGYDGKINGSYETEGKSIITYKGSEKYVTYEVTKLTATSLVINAEDMVLKMEKK